MLEESGQGAVFFAEHTHIPASRKSHWPEGPEGIKRMKVLQERVEAMKAIWTQHEASYSGEFVNIERIWSYPKPAQRPHPSVLVGGDGPTVLDRVLAFGDAWFPNYRGDESVFDRITELRSRADRPIEVHMLAAPSDPAVLERMERAGVRRANHWLPSGPRSTVEPALDLWENAISQFIGE